jgi:hypothetical protein
MIKKTLQYVLPLGLAGLLLWYAYKDMDFARMWVDLKSAHYWAVFATLITTLIAHWARAVRWNMLFEPVGYKVSTKNSFLAVMSGYFANLIFPRAGEVTRCTVLLTSEKNSTSNLHRNGISRKRARFGHARFSHAGRTRIGI